MKPEVVQEEKEALLKESLRYRKAIIDQFEGTVERVESKGKQALWIVGSVIVVYGILSLFMSRPSYKVETTSSKGKEQEEKKVVLQNIVDSPIVAMIKQHITNFLLSIAKQKLQEILEEIRYRRQNPEEEKDITIPI